MKKDDLSPIERMALRNSYAAVVRDPSTPQAERIASGLLSSPRAYAGLEYWQVNVLQEVRQAPINDAKNPV